MLILWGSVMTVLMVASTFTLMLTYTKLKAVSAKYNKLRENLEFFSEKGKLPKLLKTRSPEEYILCVDIEDEHKDHFKYYNVTMPKESKVRAPGYWWLCLTFNQCGHRVTFKGALTWRMFLCRVGSEKEIRYDL